MELKLTFELPYFETVDILDKSFGSIKKGKPHRFSNLVPFHELEAAVQNVLEKPVCLTITSTVTLFKDRSSTRWIETAKGTTGTK